jgi:hypothetical protein
MDSMLERVYQEPAQVARIRAKRELRNKAEQTSAETGYTDEPPF